MSPFTVQPQKSHRVTQSPRPKGRSHRHHLCTGEASEHVGRRAGRKGPCVTIADRAREMSPNSGWWERWGTKENHAPNPSRHPPSQISQAPSCGFSIFIQGRRVHNRLSRARAVWLEGPLFPAQVRFVTSGGMQMRTGAGFLLLTLHSFLLQHRSSHCWDSSAPFLERE